MVRASVLKIVISYDSTLSMAADYDMWFRIMQHTKGRNLGEVLLYYRRGNSNDAKKHADKMWRESYAVRRRICDAYARNAQDRKRMSREIDLEMKSKKSVMDAFRIYRELIMGLQRDINRESNDYLIVKRNIYLKIYAVCIAGNIAGYAKILNVIYKCLLNVRYSLGKKYQYREQEGNEP